MAHNSQRSVPASAPKIVQPEKHETHPVKYEDLIQAKVKVMDKEGNLYYLEPARKSGEFVLRPMPK